MNEHETLMPIEIIEHRIYLLRGHRVMLSFELAELYQVEPRVLIQAVKRNVSRFPKDFMFQLSAEEFGNLKSQFVISRNSLRSQFVILKKTGKHFKYPPYAFTEQGVAMLSSVLRSERAVHVNIEIMRAFVHLRKMLISNKNLARKLNELEKKYDAQFKVVFDAIRELMHPPLPKQPRAGFRQT